MAKTLSSLTCWYDHPATAWSGALPLGNGRLGALVFGGPAVEKMPLNEESVWTGGPYDPTQEEAWKALPEIRKLVFEGRHREAHYLFGRTMMGEPWTQMKFQPTATLDLLFPGHDEVLDYARSLDLESAEATVAYTLDGVRYTRTCFVSEPDQVVAVRIRADQPGQLTFTADLSGQSEGDGHWERGAAGDNQLVLRGKTASDQGIEGRVRFETRLQARVTGGSVSSAEGPLSIRGADEVLLLVAIRTNVRSHKDLDADPARAQTDLEAVEAKDGDRLLADHLDEYRALFGRVELDLPRDASSSLPTDERLRRVARDQDPALFALYFQFGRYLLLASSRSCRLPANLQGVWTESLHPAWEGKYTVNINLPMNYWPAESAHLPECVEPLTALVEGLAETGARQARCHYNAGGWVLHQNTDAWLAPAPMDGPTWGTWPVGGAWLCIHLWQHYCYSGDRAYLERIYPLLKGAADFFLDTLVEHPDKGWLVTCPSNSPENFPAAPGNERYRDEQIGNFCPGTTICAGPTMDLQILRDLFNACIGAAEQLETDEDLRSRWSATRDRLAPMQVGSRGNLQEWLEDWGEMEHQHRHLSHLYGAFPGSQITLEETPGLVEAAKRTLAQRGDGGTGFGMAWKTALWARFRDPDHALVCLTNLLARNTCDNLFSACFKEPQVDGLFGGCGAIAEMLLQSHNGAVRLLPALPLEWGTGRYRGLRARGGLEAEVAWKDGRAVSATLKAAGTGSCTLVAPPGQQVVSLNIDGRAQPKAGGEEVELSYTAGQCIELRFGERLAEPPVSDSDLGLFQQDFPPSTFRARRQRVFDLIGSGHALLQGAGPMEVGEQFRQSNEFYYLCGVEVPQAYLLMSGDRQHTTLFLPPRDAKAAQVEQGLTADNPALVRRLTGVDEVRGTEELTACLRQAAPKVVYTPHERAELGKFARDGFWGARRKRALDAWDSVVPREERFISLIRKRLPGVGIEDLSPALDAMRGVKDPTEIELMRRAGKLSALAVVEAMKVTRPGLSEYHLHAIARYIYRAGGARGEGYRSIVASGERIWFNHYDRNDQPLVDGELVLMDGAPDLNYYTSDIGRMWPINGTYAPWQRELYGFMVEYHKVLLDHIRPGITADTILDETNAIMAEWLKTNRLSASAYRRAGEQALSYKGHLSHPVGMSVHDQGKYRGGPLEPGQVFAVDPQLWIPEDNLYIRVEDTVVVTADGIENLTADAPLELDDVEALMKEGGTPFPLLNC